MLRGADPRSITHKITHVGVAVDLHKGQQQHWIRGILTDPSSPHQFCNTGVEAYKLVNI